MQVALPFVNRRPYSICTNRRCVSRDCPASWPSSHHGHGVKGGASEISKSRWSTLPSRNARSDKFAVTSKKSTENAEAEGGDSGGDSPGGKKIATLGEPGGLGGPDDLMHRLVAAVGMVVRVMVVDRGNVVYVFWAASLLRAASFSGYCNILEVSPRAPILHDVCASVPKIDFYRSMTAPVSMCTIAPGIAWSPVPICPFRKSLGGLKISAYGPPPDVQHRVPKPDACFRSELCSRCLRMPTRGPIPPSENDRVLVLSSSLIQIQVGVVRPLRMDGRGVLHTWNGVNPDHRTCSLCKKPVHSR